MRQLLLITFIFHLAFRHSIVLNMLCIVAAWHCISCMKSHGKRCGCLSSRYLAINKYWIVATVSSLTPHVYAHAHRRTRTHTHAHARTHTHTHTDAHARIHARSRTLTRTRTHTHTQVHARTCTHAHAHAHTYTQDQLLIGLAWTRT